MRIVVCVKPVPDPREFHRLSVDTKRGTIIREGVPLVINPLDRHALEAAVRLRDELGGDVVAVSMAPPQASSVMRETLAMGADRAILLTDPRFAGSDTLATAYVLSCALRRIEGLNLVICGDETVDGGTAQVSSQLAEFLGLPNIMHAVGLKGAEGGGIVADSKMEHGVFEVEMTLPAVVSVLREINEPRLITLMDILDAEQKEITLWEARDLDLSEPWVGLEGSPTKMLGVSEPKIQKQAEIIGGSPREQAEELASRLHRLGLL
jgi:electron transfer flavoprotein beta subunit